MPKTLLIIDVQKSAVSKPEIAQRIEQLQYEYDTVYVSKFNNNNSPLLKFLELSGYNDENLAFVPRNDAVIYNKSGYTSSATMLESI